MKQGVLRHTLVVGMAIVLLGVGCSAQSLSERSEVAQVDIFVKADVDFPAPLPAPVTAVTPEQQAMEARLLASVIRLVFNVSHGDESHLSKGHGTVKDGRYLVTHNHYSVPMSETRAARVEGLNGVTLYRADGTVLIEMPVMLFKVVYEEDETLVLDFGEGYFDRLGVPSADFLPMRELTLANGAELAQVDWNGDVAHIDWVTLNGLETVDGTLVMVLANGLRPGASGGGVFWNGYHVANNWSSVAETNGAGETVQELSLAVVNSSQVAGALGNDQAGETATSAQPDVSMPDNLGSGLTSN